MKKFTLLSFAALLSTGLMAQSDSKVAGKVPVMRNNFNQNTVANKGGSSVFATIYTQDFASGVPAGWAITDSSGGGKIWTYDTDGPSGASGSPADAILSPTASNGFMIMDDDNYGQGTGATRTDLITTAINCAAFPSVKIKFVDFYRHYVPAASEAVLYVSNDSVNWTDMYHAETGLANNAATTNPHNVELDLTSVAGGQSTVYLMFTYRGDWGYYWEIDDIELFEPSAVDAGVAATAFPFTGCSLSSTSPVSISVFNSGATAISNVPVSYSVNGGTAVNETISNTIAPNDTFLYTFTQTADLSAGGVHAISLSATLTGDGNAANDTTTAYALSVASISVQTNAYTMGFETTDDYSGYTVEDVDGDGTSFDIINTLTHTGGFCLRKPGSGIPDNNWIFTTCFDFDAATPYSLTFWYKNFELATPCEIAAHLATSNTNTATTTNIVTCPIPADTTYQFSNNTFTVPTTGKYYIGFNFFAQGATSSLRLDDIVVSVVSAIGDNEATSITAYPNPSNGLVALKGLSGNGVVSVVNQMGQVVVTKSFSNQTSLGLDLTAQPAGLYHVKVQNGNTISNLTINVNR